MSAGQPTNTRKRQLAKKTPRKMVPHGPGGQRLRPAPRVKTTPRTPQAKAHGVRVVQQAAHPTYGPTKRNHPVSRAKPRSAKAKAHGRQVVRHAAQEVRHKEQRKARRYITQNPVKGLQRSEANAVHALFELRQSNPKKYDENLKGKHVPDEITKALHKSDPLETGLKDVAGGIKSGASHLHSSQNNLAAVTFPQSKALASSKPSKTAGKVLENAAREAINIPANIVPSTAHIIKPVYNHPTDPKAYVKSAKRLGKATASLPLALYHHPGKTFVEHPLSSALLVAPIPRAPGLVAGGVARRVGRMPHPKPRELPGTAMKVVEPTSKSYFKARRQAKKPIRQVEDQHIEHRVDAEVALQEDLARKAQASTYRKAYRARKKVVGKAQARNEAADLARKEQVKVRKEQQRNSHERLALVEKPKYRGNANHMQLVNPGGKAEVFKDSADATSAATRYNAKNPVEMVPQPVKGGYLVVPKSAVERFAQHEANTKTGPISAGFKAYNTLWRKNVLATHPTWYAGNTIEAAVRSLASGVGPTSYIRGYKSLAELKRIDPKKYEEMTGHATKGGHLSMQVHLPDENVIDVTGHGFLADTARKIQKMRDKPGVRPVADAWNNLTDFTMGTLSGRAESFFQTGMLGKELSRSPLMDGHILKTSKAAIEDAAKGMRETHNQIALGKAVDRMYGQYGKFSPFMRKAISHYTPFIAWTLNSLKWLYHYLPADHPVLTATAASVQPYVDEWLKDRGLSAFVKGALPSFLQGSIPTKGGYARFPTRYTPFAIAAGFPEDLASAILPQFKGAIDLMQHQINWKGQKVKNPDDTPMDPLQLSVMAALTLLEGAVPASQQFIDPSTHYEKGARTPKALMKPRSGAEIGRSFNPLAKVPKKKAKKKKKSSSLYDTGPTTTKPKSLYDSPSTTKKQKSLYDSP